ncbi:MAG TPA: SurA N-terminal domain-containing protein [Burkholderiales bacterium]|nr:SurA N-terminal domain-containing protein [Burkholderiales bacterium]
MFDFFQKHKRFAQVLLVLIALTFVTWGIESYTSMRGGRDTVATVNGSEISQAEFNEQLRLQQERLRQMFGGAVDPQALDNPESRRALLDSLIDQRLVAGHAAKANLFMSREQVIEAITKAPEFQENGEFSPARYSAYLASRGLTDQGNVAQLQSQLPLARLVGSVADTAIASRTVAQRLAAIESQVREVSEARIPVQQFLAQAKVDEAEVKAYYDANLAEFRTPERIRAEYVVLSAESLGRGETVSEDEIKAAYEARAPDYRTEAQRRASHILVKTREEAEKLLAEAKKNPGGFAALAEKHSQDPGSADKGGDLGWFSRGMMVKPFEDAVFRLAEGAIDLVQSEFGFHVVRVTGIQPGKARPLAEVRKELADELARRKGARKFNETAEAFNNLVYEQPESLKPAAAKFDLKVQTTGWISRSAAQELGALDNPKLLEALFSPEAIRTRHNTDAIEVAPNTLVAARVLEHQAAKQREFAEVKEEIARLLQQRKASELAYKEGVAKLERLEKGEDAGLAWGPPRRVSRREAQGMPADVLRRVVSADVSKLPAYVGMPIPDAGYLVLRISNVIDVDPKLDDTQTAQRIAGMLGAAQYEAFVASLRGRADIEVRPSILESK